MEKIYMIEAGDEWFSIGNSREVAREYLKYDTATYGTDFEKITGVYTPWTKDGNNMPRHIWRDMASRSEDEAENELLDYMFDLLKQGEITRPRQFSVYDLAVDGIVMLANRFIEREDEQLWSDIELGDAELVSLAKELAQIRGTKIGEEEIGYVVAALEQKRENELVIMPINIRRKDRERLKAQAKAENFRNLTAFVLKTCLDRCDK